MGSKDFNEVTLPGNLPGDKSVIAEDTSESDLDEFPSEETRIEPNFLSTQAPRRPAASGTLEALAASRSQARQGEQTSQPRASVPRDAKLAALQSLSLEGGTASTRLPPSPRSQGGSKLPWVLLFLIAAGFGGKVLWEKYHPPETVRPDQPTVRTEVVQSTGGAQQTYIASGYISARDPVGIGGPTGQLVREVRVQVNDRVTKGQVVVNIDDSAAQAELSQIKNEIAEAERAYHQVKTYYEAGAATGAALFTAQSAVNLARGKTRPAESRISAAHIRTLTTGTVLEVLVHPGETVPVGGVVVKIADLHNLVAVVDVPEGDIVKIRRGQQVDVTSETFPGKSIKGTVSVISEQADRARGTVNVRVDLAVTEDYLKTNMNVKCTFLPLQGEAPRLFVSRSSVTPQNTVFVVGTNRIVTARPVKLGAAEGSSMEIVSGLTAGERIVSDALSVHDGQQLAQ